MHVVICCCWINPEEMKDSLIGQISRSVMDEDSRITVELGNESNAETMEKFLSMVE